MSKIKVLCLHLRLWFCRSALRSLPGPRPHPSQRLPAPPPSPECASNAAPPRAPLDPPSGTQHCVFILLSYSSHFPLRFYNVPGTSAHLFCFIFYIPLTCRVRGVLDWAYWCYEVFLSQGLKTPVQVGLQSRRTFLLMKLQIPEEIHSGSMGGSIRAQALCPGIPSALVSEVSSLFSVQPVATGWATDFSVQVSGGENAFP